MSKIDLHNNRSEKIKEKKLLNVTRSFDQTIHGFLFPI